MSRPRDRVIRSPRIAARRRAVRVARRRRRRNVTIAAFTVIVLGIGALALTHSAVFGLQRIDVVGMKAVPRDQIVGASGLRLGQRAIGINLEEVAARVRSLPGIAEAKVAREGSLGIRITVTERTAALEVHSGPSRWLLDRDGRSIDAAHRGTDPLPLVILPASPSPQVAAAAEPQILSVWSQMPVAFRSHVSSFELPAGAIAFRMDGMLVLFGNSENVAQKIQAIAAVIDRVKRDHHRVVQIDVSSPDQPAARIA
jgi:cell division protein FtsQ